MTASRALLMKVYRLIERAIYSENGMEGDEGQAMLDEIEPFLTDEDRAMLDREAEIRETLPET